MIGYVGSIGRTGLQGPSKGVLSWANDAWSAWDFVADQARWSNVDVGALANTPNWTFTRASTGYAQNQAGVLIPFASGELRRTDKGVLIEGARTNLCPRSQELDDASWSSDEMLAFGAGSVANATTAPDGTSTADKCVENTAATTQHRMKRTVTVSSGAAYTLSVYAKASGRHLWLRINCATVVANATFDLTTGTVAATTSGTATIQALANGWYRCSLTGTTDSTSLQALVNLIPTSNSTANYTGDGASGLFLWGVQIEAGSHVSSYIPTTTASATRAADSLIVTGVTGLDYPLTLYAEFERAVDTGGTELFLATYASANERAEVGVDGSDRALARMIIGGSVDGSSVVTGAISIGSITKTAGRQQANSVQSARAGSLGTEDTDTGGADPTAPTTVGFGATASGANPSFGYLRRAAIYASAKTDAQLQAMTT